MDKDIREFLDRAEQKRRYEQERKRKNKRLANQIERQKRKSHRNAIQNGADLLCGGHAKTDEELRLLADNERDYKKGMKPITKHRTPKEQKEYDWKNRPRFISVPMGGQNKRH